MRKALIAVVTLTLIGAAISAFAPGKTEAGTVASLPSIESLRTQTPISPDSVDFEEIIQPIYNRFGFVEGAPANIAKGMPVQVL